MVNNARQTTHDFDVIVVGGGHAGCEAALAAAGMGARVCLATLRADTVGALSCNPAIGGVGKGQIVREIDALGGAMARITDETAIQYRMLNTSKGEAVRALRAQVDKDSYAEAMQRRVSAHTHLSVHEGCVDDLLVENHKVQGVVLDDGSPIRAPRVILTNGTFLRGLMHTGESKATGGRIGEGAVQGLSAALERLGFESGRLKTGTPPRLAAESIDWSQVTPQEGDTAPDGFSHFVDPPRREWSQCYVTRTNPRVHEVIRENLDRSPMFVGEIEGVGPRYCPSIEDKVVRFAEREGHTVHLEPEGRSTNSIYVNGTSTSLPADVQQKIVAEIPGLENAEFLRFGYAVEYDFFPPCQIDVTFESRRIPGLYLAGQICGTSGYEEAGAQGFLAGVNAVLSLRGEEPLILGREEAYMGVLADDLVRTDPREPYRMFTSRAEYRLLLRHDNADLRLAERGHALGLLTAAELSQVERKRQKIGEVTEWLEGRRVDGDSLLSRLKRPGATFDQLYAEAPELRDLDFDDHVAQQVLINTRYQTYIERQQAQVERLRRHESWRIPDALRFEEVFGLRREAVEKLERIRPHTLGQASRIAGVTPADLNLVMIAMTAREAEDGTTDTTDRGNDA